MRPPKLLVQLIIDLIAEHVLANVDCLERSTGGEDAGQMMPATAS